MKKNLRVRNLAINSYFGALVITIIGSLAALYILYVGLEVPFPSFAAHTHEIEDNL